VKDKCLKTLSHGGTASWLEEADRSLYREGASATRVNYDDRYTVAHCRSKLGRLLQNLEQDALLDAKQARLVSASVMYSE